MPVDRPKILRVIARLNVGGPARQALILHERLPALGFESRLVHGQVADGEASLEDQIEARGLGSIRLPELGRRIRLWSDLRAFTRLLRLVFAERPDVVHTHTAKAGALGRLAAIAYNATRGRDRRCVVIHTFHGHVFQGYFGTAGSWATRAIERALARATDRIVTISPRQWEDIVGRYGIAPPGRVAVVRLGLELERFLELGAVTPSFRRELGFPDECVLFGYVGRLVAIKDLGALLDALALALPRAPAIRLALVGDGDQRPALEAHAKRVGVGHAVRFLGWRRDLETVYSGVDAVVISSLNEGTPVALVEAMAAGRPVAATRVGGVPDVVADGVTGWLVPPGTPRAMADALVRLATSPAERLRMGAEGRLVAARYRYDHLLTALAGLYRSALAARRPADAPATARPPARSLPEPCPSAAPPRAPGSTASIGVVIVNFNSSEQTLQTLRTVEAQLAGEPWEGIVIDNASTIDDVEGLNAVPAAVRVIRNPVNRGFGAAVNQGVSALRAPLILLLNPDTVPQPGAIAALRAEMAASPDCAVAGPDILNPDGSRQGSARGDPNLFTGLFGRSTLLSRVFPRLYWVRRNIRTPDDVPPGQSGMPVDWVSGACMLLQRRAFEEAGGFDDRYFLYWEDADLGRRLRQAGHTVRYVPAARVSHAIGQSSRTVQQLAIREFHRSAYRYYTSHVAPSRWNPARLAATTVLALRCRYYLRKAGRDIRPDNPGQ